MNIRLTCPSCSRTFRTKAAPEVDCSCGQRIKLRNRLQPDRFQKAVRDFQQWVRRINQFPEG